MQVGFGALWEKVRADDEGGGYAKSYYYSHFIIPIRIIWSRLDLNLTHSALNANADELQNTQDRARGGNNSKGVWVPPRKKKKKKVYGYHVVSLTSCGRLFYVHGKP